MKTKQEIEKELENLQALHHVALCEMNYNLANTLKKDIKKLEVELSYLPTQSSSKEREWINGR